MKIPTMRRDLKNACIALGISLKLQGFHLLLLFEPGWVDLIVPCEKHLTIASQWPTVTHSAPTSFFRSNVLFHLFSHGNTSCVLICFGTPSPAIKLTDFARRWKNLRQRSELRDTTGPNWSETSWSSSAIMHIKYDKLYWIRLYFVDF